MLFQMCYGPEVQEVYEFIRNKPGIDITILAEKFRYMETDKISSLIESALTILVDLQFVYRAGKNYYPVEDRLWSNREVILKLQKIVLSGKQKDESLNYVFASMYDQLFVKPDTLFVTNLHYQVNRKFNKTLIGHEKINAWKRMMECWGLGRRVYSGFYALPHFSLLSEIINYAGEWEGGLHPFCETIINPILPCVTDEGNIFKGLIYGLIFLHDLNVLHISYKQDLPYKSYGPNNEYNWIKLERRVG